MKDLGVFFSSDFTFDYHIKNMVRKGLNLSAWILRTFKTRTTFTMKILLKTLLIPILEYASIIWSPHKQHLINLIESVQRNFTRRFSEFQEIDEITGLPTCNTDYHQRLKTLKIYSLQRRRERYMILFLYKIIIGTYPNPGFDLTSVTRNYRIVNGITIPSKSNPRAPEWVQTARRTSFFFMGPALFNLLPPRLRVPKYLIAPTPKLQEEFKTQVDKYLSRVPDQPTTEGLDRDAPTNSLLDQDRYKQARAQ